MSKKEIEKTETLTPQQDMFCVLYTTIGEETFSNGTKSAEAAEYAPASSRTTAWKLLRTPKIRERIAELHQENMSRNLISVDSQLSKLEHLRRKAEEKQDLSTAVRCVELIGKYLCMFTDKHSFVAEPPQERKSQDDAKAKELAGLLSAAIESKYTGRPLVESVECLPEQPTTDERQEKDSITQKETRQPPKGASLEDTIHPSDNTTDFEN
jgi:hypothetical protein